MTKGRVKEGVILMVSLVVGLCGGMQGSVIKAVVGESKEW